MEKIEFFNQRVTELEKGLESNHPNFDEMDLYQVKKEMLLYKLENPKDTKIDILLSLMDNLDTAFDKDQTEKMNRKLNLLTIWSTIFLPLSFYTGMWGMNFDDVPLLTGDHGFWVFLGLTIFTIVGMFLYFKKHRWF
jgi:magnesium transporter|tara:strand:+ start:2693 stop:3103 length:411 start_codon:yes stop_codon:yes gene_type:complete